MLGFRRIPLTPHIVESFCCYSGNTFQAPFMLLGEVPFDFRKRKRFAV